MYNRLALPITLPNMINGQEAKPISIPIYNGLTLPNINGQGQSPFLPCITGFALTHSTIFECSRISTIKNLSITNYTLIVSTLLL
jgi:hypothetical protein